MKSPLPTERRMVPTTFLQACWCLIITRLPHCSGFRSAMIQQSKEKVSVKGILTPKAAILRKSNASFRCIEAAALQTKRTILFHGVFKCSPGRKVPLLGCRSQATSKSTPKMDERWSNCMYKVVLAVSVTICCLVQMSTGHVAQN